MHSCWSFLLPPRQAVSLGQMARRPTLRGLAAEYVSLILQETGGDKTRAAEILGISRRTLYRWDRQPENRDSVSDTETD